MKRKIFIGCLCLIFLSACAQKEKLESNNFTELTAPPLQSPALAPPVQQEPKKEEPIEEPIEEPRALFEYRGLVELLELEPSFVIDCKYATQDNFTGEIQYEMPLILIQKDVGMQLVEAQKLFMADGYGLKIFDIYRPLSVQQKLYDATPAHLKMFVAKPSSNAKHSKGIAVDCSLVDSEGNEIDMPSAYDEFTERAYTNYTGGTEKQRKNRDYLLSAMEKCGFTVYDKEWWHFTAPDREDYEALDISFSDFIINKALAVD